MEFIKRIRKQVNKAINIEAVMVATPYEECIERNSKRERKVPDEVIKRMYMNFYVPQMFEGFNGINITYNTRNKFKIEDLEKELGIPQDNPHHTLTLYNHCKKANEYIIQNIKEQNYKSERIYQKCRTVLSYAALLHDIGKLETKTFTNIKGEKTDIAHYYAHEKVSAYKSLFYTRDLRLYKKDKLAIAKFIQWHMLFLQDLSEKTYTKYKILLGEDFIEYLKIIHEADLNAM